jgi:cytochrome c553
MEAGPNPPYSGFRAIAAKTGAKPIANAPTASAPIEVCREFTRRHHIENDISVRDLPARGCEFSNVDSRHEMFWHCCMIFFVVVLVGLASQGCVPNSSPSFGHHRSASPTINLDQKTLNACLLCHSTKEMQRGPVLNGFPDWYLQNQLKKFQLGHRGKNPDNRAEQLMWMAMNKINKDSEIVALADYFSKQKPEPFLRVIRGNVDLGKILYVARCASCHGSEAKGKRDINSPPLNVQEDWFLMDQLRKYVKGQRGAHPKDTDGVIMKSSTTDLSLNDLRNIVAYIAKDLTILPPLQKVGPSNK